MGKIIIAESKLKLFLYLLGCLQEKYDSKINGKKVNSRGKFSVLRSK